MYFVAELTIGVTKHGITLILSILMHVDGTDLESLHLVLSNIFVLFLSWHNSLCSGSYL